MSTEKFRRELRDESAKWRQEGLIDGGVYEQLAQRYQFAQIESGTNNRFIAVLLGLGGILLGLGAITLVAANWQAWSRVLRMAVIFSAFLSVNAAGFYLWRRTDRQSGLAWLGNGLLLAGALIMGANIGLMSQMFHQSGSVYGLYLVWGLGVLVMAYSLRLTTLGVLSWILIYMSYWGSGWSGIWGGRSVGTPRIEMLMMYLPLLVTPLYLPLAHWCRSRTLYGLWGISLMTMLLSNNEAWILWSPIWVATVFMLPPALLWVYHSWMWQRGGRQMDARRVDPFESIGRSLAICFLSVAAYGYSFRTVWADADVLLNPSLRAVSIPYLLGCAGLWAIAIYGGWQWIKRSRSSTEPRELWMKTPVFTVVLSIMGAAVFLHIVSFTQEWEISDALGYGYVAVNIILFFIGLAMLHDGTLLGIRRRFWGGMSIVVIGLITRMFEYDTGLMLKALVLGACGIGIIAAGLWFEKKARPAAALPSA